MTVGEVECEPATDALDDPATLHLIVNPAAGNGRAGQRWNGFAATLREAGYNSRAHLTAGPGDATTIARDLARDGAQTIICVGGDGTVNEIVNGLIDGDKPVNPATRLALIPCGTGKDLGRTLGTRDIDATLTALRAGTTALIDVGRISFLDARTGYLETRFFANVADTGIGAAVAERINASSKRFGGLVTYASGAVQAIVAFSPWDAAVEVDGKTVHAGDAGMIVFANGRYFAGGMLVAPEASLCDGQLDIFVLEGVRRQALLTSLLPRVYRGRHVGQPGVVHLRGARATVRSAAGMLVEMDGEQVGRTPITVESVPRVLRVVGDASALERAGGCATDAK